MKMSKMKKNRKKLLPFFTGGVSQHSYDDAGISAKKHRDRLRCADR